MVASRKELALTVEQLQETLELRFPESVFYWRFGNGRAVKAGSKAGALQKYGYIRIGVNGSLFLAHRLVWFITYGKFPEGVIDHIDGDKSNNRIENLRDVTRKVNQQNRKKQSRLDVDMPMGVSTQRNKFGEIIGYRSYWQDMKGKKCRVYHGIGKHRSLEAALAAAISRREFEMSKLMSLGAAYTDRHGVEI